MTTLLSEVDWDTLLADAHPELVGAGHHRSRRDILLLAVGTLLIVLVASRSLIGGHGTYQVLIDPGVPPSTGLLDSVCANQDTLLDSANLGSRVLYPSAYVLCDTIRISLHAQVPAWLIARLLGPMLLWIAAFGGALVGRQLTAPLDIGRKQRTAFAVIVGSVYALSPFIFDELAASHVYYLAASAAIPFIILLCRTSDRLHPGYPIMAVGLLCALAFCQLQYVIFLPVILAVFGLWTGARARYFGIALFGFVVGLIAELPWVLADVLFPPQVNLSGYFTSSDLAALSVTPVDAVRLVGYPTPFFESTSGHVFPLVSSVLALMFALAIVSWWHLAPWRRVAVGVLVGSVILYMWGGRGAPLYGVWSRAIPWALTGLLRERYALGSILAVFIVLGVGYACARLEVRRQWWGVGVAAFFLIFGSWAFWNGHLGPYGSHRTTYPDQGKVASLIATYQRSEPGSVLTVPFGSIVKEPGWPTFGRSPFSIGGPASVLDTEGSASGSTAQVVQSLAAALDTNQGCASALPILHRLEVRYVVDWKYLIGDTPVDRTTVLDNLRTCGFHPVLSDDDVTVFVNSSLHAQPVSGRYLAVGSEADPTNAAVASAWGSPYVEYQPHGTRRGQFPAGSIAHLGQRDIVFAPGSGGTLYDEPAFLSRGGSLVGGSLRYTLDAGRLTPPLTFGDGAPLLASGSDPNVSGPVDVVYQGSEVTLPLGGATVTAAEHVQDARDVSGTTPAGAGISATVGAGGAVTLRAVDDVAGLPIRLPVVKSAYYRFDVPVEAGSGSQGTVDLIGNGSVLATAPLTGPGTTVLLAGEVASYTATLYLYVYQPGGGSTTLGPIAGSAFAAVRPLAAARQPALDGFAAVRGTATGSLPAGRSTPIPPAAVQIAATQVQNTENIQRYSLTRAGIGAAAVPSPSGPVLEVSDRLDSAGIPLALTGSPGQQVNVSVQYRGSDEARVRLRLVSGAQEVGSSAWVDAGSGWRSMELSAVVLGGEADPYLYLETAGQSGREVAVQFRSVSTSIVPPAPMLVSDAALTTSVTGGPAFRFERSDRHWVYLGTAYDPFYQLSGVEVVRRLDPSADGIGNAWLISSSPATLSVTYLPETEFEWELVAVACVLSIALFGLLLLAIGSLRRRRRAKRRGVPTPVPELPELPADPWGPGIRAPGPVPSPPGSRRPMKERSRT